MYTYYNQSTKRHFECIKLMEMIQAKGLKNLNNIKTMWISMLAPFKQVHNEYKTFMVKMVNDGASIFSVKTSYELLCNVEIIMGVATPFWAKCEGEAHTPKSGKLESCGTPENSELDCRGQISSHLNVPGVIGKVLECRCPKWPRIGHLDICSPSYGQKKGRESNWQFDSRPLKVGNRHVPDVRSGSPTWCWKALFEGYKFGSDLVPIGGRGEELRSPKVPGVQTGTVSGQFRDSTSGVPRKRAIRMPLPWANAEYTIGSMVVASPEPGPWCVM
jgi:hypothetical protein